MIDCRITLTLAVRHTSWYDFVDKGKAGDVYSNDDVVYVFVEKYVDDSGPVGIEYLHYMSHHPDGTSHDVSSRLGEAY